MGNILYLPGGARESGRETGPDPAGLAREATIGAGTPRRKGRDLGHADGPLFNLVEKYTAARIASGEVARKTAHDQRLTLLHFAATFGNRPVKTMGEADVLRWMAEIEHDRPATRRRKRSEVRLFCRWMAGRRRRYIPYDPFIDLKAPRQPRTVPRGAAGRGCLAIRGRRAVRADGGGGVMADDQLMNAVWRVVQAITDPGRKPDYHRFVLQRHREEWPTLWAALEDLVHQATKREPSE